MTDLIVQEVEKSLVIYRRMSTAIANCHRIDQCKDIANKAVALASYYKQIKDEETERKFIEVRLRAWRRIAEILKVVDVSKCETQVAKAKKVRETFGEEAVKEMSDSRILELLKLSTVSDKDFKTTLKCTSLTGGIANFLQHTPEVIRQVEEERRKNEALWKAKREENRKEEDEDEEQEHKERADFAHMQQTLDAARVAREEIGVTLERFDRREMKQLVFIHSAELHEVMRQAAFDNKCTMHEILRRGLRCWLLANGYEYPV